jgi:hypothetical protein
LDKYPLLEIIRATLPHTLPVRAASRPTRVINGKIYEILASSLILLLFPLCKCAPSCGITCSLILILRELTVSPLAAFLTDGLDR